MFFKGNYIQELPYNKELVVDENRASSYYWKEIQETSKQTILI